MFLPKSKNYLNYEIFLITYFSSRGEKRQAWKTFVTWGKRHGTAQNDEESNSTEFFFILFWESMPHKAGFDCFPSEQGVRSEVSQCPPGPGAGSGDPSGSEEPSWPSYPARKSWNDLGNLGGSSPGPALPSRAREGPCTPYSAERQNTSSSGNSKWVQIKVN